MWAKELSQAAGLDIDRADEEGEKVPMDDESAGTPAGSTEGRLQFGIRAAAARAQEQQGMVAHGIQPNPKTGSASSGSGGPATALVKGVPQAPSPNPAHTERPRQGVGQFPGVPPPMLFGAVDFAATAKAEAARQRPSQNL